MGWLQSLLSPLKKLWVRAHSAQNKRRGIYILYEDVKSCQYEDVHVLWSILVESSSSHKPPVILPSTQAKLLCPPPKQVNERG
ncbi:hypothetical protein SOVF_180710 [Spinacia oleracea]|nr:hypothetical protein SOVF_180710 [Spinacia oleracea]